MALFASCCAVGDCASAFFTTWARYWMVSVLLAALLSALLLTSPRFQVRVPVAPGAGWEAIV